MLISLGAGLWLWGNSGLNGLVVLTLSGALVRVDGNSGRRVALDLRACLKIQNLGWPCDLMAIVKQAIHEPHLVLVTTASATMELMDRSLSQFLVFLTSHEAPG